MVPALPHPLCLTRPPHHHCDPPHHNHCDAPPHHRDPNRDRHMTIVVIIITFDIDLRKNYES